MPAALNRAIDLVDCFWFEGTETPSLGSPVLVSAWMEHASFEQGERRAGAGRDDRSRQMSAMKWIVGSLTAMVVTAGSLASVAGPAQAYTGANCNANGIAWLGNVVDVDTFRIDTGSGKVDFGDVPHVGVAPQENAVVCWYSTGAYEIRGRVFADSAYLPTRATAEITPYLSDGRQKTSHSVSATAPGTNGVPNTAFGEATSVSNASIDRVRIRLYSTVPYSGALLRHTHYVDRGD